MKNKQTASHRKDVALEDSKRTDKPIRFRAKKHIYWEDWGHMRLVFCKDEIYEGILHSDGKVTAYSQKFDVSDYVELNEIEIL